MVSTLIVVWVGYLVSRLSSGLAFTGVMVYAVYDSESWSKGLLEGLLMCLAVFALGLSVAFLTGAIRRSQTTE